jgi:hypothetical protein
MVQNARPYTFIIECDRRSLAKRQEDERSQLDAERRRAAALREQQDLKERQAREAKRKKVEEEERRAAALRMQQDQATEAGRKRVEEEEGRFWASLDLRREQCGHASSFSDSNWTMLSAHDKWKACRDAGTIKRICEQCSAESGVAMRENRFALLIDAVFTSHEITPEKVASGVFYQDTFEPRGCCPSMFRMLSVLLRPTTLKFR